MQLGALGEFVAAIAALITLIHLAVQIRQNTRGLRISTLESGIRGLQAHTRALIGDRELLRVHFEGLAGFDDLGREDRLRFHGLMFNLMLEYQLFRRSFDGGAQSHREFAGKSLEEWDRLAISFLRTPGPHLSLPPRGRLEGPTSPSVKPPRKVGI